MNKFNLIDICTLTMGQSPDSSSYNSNHNGLPFYQGNSDFGKINPTPHVWCISPKKIAKKGDILISVRAPIGDLNMAGEDCCIGRGLASIRTNNSDVLDQNYLFNFLKSKKIALKSKGTGSTFEAINKAELANLEIMIPDICFQKKISNEIEYLESQIDFKIKQLSYFEELIKSRFIEMFDSESNREKLVNLCKFINGDRGKNYPSASDRITSGIPFINAGHLENNVVCFDNMDYISEQKYESLSSGKVQKDDIIYCLRGSLGKKGIVNFDKGAIASSLLILRTNSKIRPLFLLYSLDQEYVLTQMKASNNGSSQPNLSAQSVKQYDIILPTIDRQIEFESYVRLIDKSRLIVQQQIKDLQELLEKKMDEYFG